MQDLVRRLNCSSASVVRTALTAALCSHGNAMPKLRSLGTMAACGQAMAQLLGAQIAFMWCINLFLRRRALDARYERLRHRRKGRLSSLAIFARILAKPIFYPKPSSYRGSTLSTKRIEPLQLLAGATLGCRRCLISSFSLSRMWKSLPTPPVCTSLPQRHRTIVDLQKSPRFPVRWRNDGRVAW